MDSNRWQSKRAAIVLLGFLGPFAPELTLAQYNADLHEKAIRTRCADLIDNEERMGCMRGDITVIESIRRRERAEKLRQKKTESAPRSSRRIVEPEAPPIPEKAPTARPAQAEPALPAASAAPVAPAIVVAEPAPKISGTLAVEPRSGGSAGLKSWLEWMRGPDRRESTNVEIDPASIGPGRFASPGLAQSLKEERERNIGTAAAPGIVVAPPRPTAADRPEAPSNNPPIVDVGLGRTPRGSEVCHSGEDGSGYHCHPAMTPVDVKRDETAERLAIRKAQETASSDRCENWQSPMRSSHRITDCMGAFRTKSRLHAGVDLGNGQKANTKVFAVAPGKIVQAGYQGGYGCVIAIEHEKCPPAMAPYPNFFNDKCVSFYAHLEYEGGKRKRTCPGVGKLGQKVNSCSPIAVMGGTGGNYAKHLHFEMRLRRQSQVRINPLVALGPELRGASSNGAACQRTNDWLASSPNGFRTHKIKSASTRNAQR